MPCTQIGRARGNQILVSIKVVTLRGLQQLQRQNSSKIDDSGTTHWAEFALRITDSK